MKRRTFLKLSPAFVALPLSLGLTSCAPKTKNPVVDESDETENQPFDLGMSLEQARQYNEGNGGLFIHRDDKFYPVPDHIYAYQELVIMEGTTFSSNTLSENDELVYISDTVNPSSVFYVFSPIIDTGSTALLAFHLHEDYITGMQEITLETSQKSFSSIKNVTLNDLSVTDFCSTHSGVEAGTYESSNDCYATGFVDLSPSETSITIGYYEGTQYQEVTLDGTLPYYTFDSEAVIPAFLTPTKQGYAIVDTSLLIKGMDYAFGWSELWPNNATIISITD